MTSKSSKPSPVPQKLLTIPEVADLIQASDKWVRQQIAASKLRAHRLGRCIRISPEDLDLFLKSIRY